MGIGSDICICFILYRVNDQCIAVLAEVEFCYPSIVLTHQLPPRMDCDRFLHNISSHSFPTHHTELASKYIYIYMDK